MGKNNCFEGGPVKKLFRDIYLDFKNWCSIQTIPVILHGRYMPRPEDENIYPETSPMSF